MVTPRSIFQYTCFRTYLGDCYAATKRARAGWSYPVWAKKLGLRSHSTLVMIIKGKRAPGPALTQALTRELGLGPREAAYFADLVALAKASASPSVRDTLAERVGKARSAKPCRIIDPISFQTIAEWHHYAIRELVHLRSFREDPEWIAGKLGHRISPREARLALARLLRLGLLGRGPRGRLEYRDGNIDTVSETAVEAIKRFHEAALENAKRSVRTVPVHERALYATTFAMPRANVDKAKALMRKFQYDLFELLEERPADAVYHLELALFPLTEPEEQS